MASQYLLQALVALLILRETMIAYKDFFFPNTVVAYMYMFGLSWGLALWIGKDKLVATLIGLAMISLKAAYRYIAGMYKLRSKALDMGAFMVGMLGIMLGAQGLKGVRNRRAINWVVFVGLIYWLASLEEWVLHRYVMHCYQNWPWLDNLQTTVWPFTHMKRACSVHKDHHVSVGPDMKLKEVKNEKELYFNWEITMVTFGLFFPIAVGLAYMLDLGVPGWVGALGVGACFALVFAFVWNSVHPTMHDYKLDIGLLTGVPNVAWKLDESGLYHRNHEIHHQVKGEKKGNFNVVFLGVDDVMGTNRLG